MTVVVNVYLNVTMLAWYHKSSACIILLSTPFLLVIEFRRIFVKFYFLVFKVILSACILSDA
jgi:hypothetical protein